MTRLLLAIAFAACALIAASCSKPGPGNTLVVTDGGMAMLIPGMDAWESSPWAGTDVHWLPYGAHEQLQLHHSLGRTPIGVITYISFVESGQNPSQAAGDLARLVDVTSDHVTVWNDTNSIFFARVVVF